MQPARREIGGNLISRKLSYLFAIGAVSLAFFAARSIHAGAPGARVLGAGAVGNPEKTSQKAMAAPALPAPGTYKIDPVHSFAFFGARHHVVGLVRGRFEKVTGTITSSK